ncbi:HET-domain-containing protein, partial [Microthyrium microscopicum]
CDSYHQACQPSRLTTLPSRVLYISDEHVSVFESEGVQARYSALSYVWGSGDTLRTTKATISAHTRGIARSTLPRTLEDAITITHYIGLSYIWIDALCILQDDPEDMQQEISRMDKIYSNAYVTIVAASSTDSSSGIFATDTSGHFAREIQPRAWTFQEGLLSTRKLYFTANEVSFECRDNRDATFFWHNLVSEYSSRLLTDENDKLPAVAGLARHMQIQNGGTYLAGLWAESFQSDLSWSCPEPCSRRSTQYRCPSWSWAS